MALISVIIPSYNYGHLIGETLLSVQNQSYTDWEAIVIDDGSSDNTKQVVSSLSLTDQRIKYFYQNNSGLSSARNTGIKHSNGKYIQFLDADDLIEPNKLKFQSEFLESHTETDLIYGNNWFFYSEEPEKLFRNRKEPFDKDWMPKTEGSGLSLIKALVTDGIMVVHGPLIRRTVIEQTGFFDERLKAREDHDYWIRMALLGFSFSFQDKVDTCSLTRIHKSSMQGTKGYMSLHFDLFRSLMVEKFLGIDSIGPFNKTDPAILITKYGSDWQNIIEIVCFYHIRRYKINSGLRFGLKALKLSNQPARHLFMVFFSYIRRFLFGRF